MAVDGKVLLMNRKFPAGVERLVFIAGNAVLEGSGGQRSTGGSG